jgi:ATP-dependent DNA helicase RecG
MNEAEVLELIKIGEGWTIDFKEKPPKPAKLAETIVSLANHQGGYILIGINDEGRVVGYSPTKEDMVNILRAARDCSSPPIEFVDIQEVEVEGKPVLVLQISEARDHVYSTADGKYLIRQGSENKAISEYEMYQLAVKRQKIIFEELPIEEATYNDIDLEKVRLYLRKREERFGITLSLPLEDVLKSRGCIVEKDKKLVPTNAGILLFGKNPQRFLPQSIITAVRYVGKDVTGEYIDRKEITGTLPELIDEAVSWVDRNMLHGGRIERVERKEVHQYPLRSVREAIVNAVAHRDYSIRGSRILLFMFDDRIEVHSPGTLPPGVTLETLVSSQFSRNKNVVLVLLELGYVEALGSGIDSMIKEMKKEGLPEPQFDQRGITFITTLYGRKALAIPIKELGLNERQIKALEYIKEHGKITNREYRKIFGVGKATAARDLSDMVKKEIIESVGKIGRSVHYILKAPFR